MQSNLNKFLEDTLVFEGNYVNDPHDPGGETKYGICKRDYPDLDIKNLTKDQAKAIYKSKYWDKIKGDDLPSGIDLWVGDAAINSGPVQAAKWLQRALNVSTVDGVIGPQTVLAATKADKRSVILSMSEQRITMLRGLKTWNRYGPGWTNRVSDLTKTCLAM